MMDDQWASYKIKYVQTTDINETIDFEVVENERIIVSNKANGVKLVIIRN